MANDLDLESARTAKIVIENYSDHDMELSEGTVTCSGEFVTAPPAEILNKETKDFEVGSKNSKGPRGWVFYKMAVDGKVETIRIFWDHPVGSGPSRYELSFKPYKCDFKQDPENPTGHHQTINFKITRVSKDQSNINPYEC